MLSPQSNSDNSFIQSTKKFKLESNINVVPYIDVMLVLLIVFMITAPLMTQGIKVNLPKQQSTTMKANDNTIIITVNNVGEYFINLGGQSTQDNAQAVSKDELLILLTKANNLQDEPLQVFIEGDEQLAYGQVVALMSELQQADIFNIGLVTEPLAVKR